MPSSRTHQARKGKRRGGTRRTRRQRGGNPRIARNVQTAMRESQKNPNGNYFYVVKDDNIYEGYAMFIGQRFEYGASVSNLGAKEAEETRERAAAKYPYEECLFFFEFTLPNEEGKQYPSSPPIVKHKTAGIKNYRLHPNLYGTGRKTLTGKEDEKTCLAILNTFGSEWSKEMTIWNVLGAMQALFMENPGLSEPGQVHLKNTTPQGQLYNRQVLYESIDITSTVYDMVVKSLQPTSTPNNLKFNNAKVASQKIPAFVKPFTEILAKRAYSALGFLIGKLELFVEATGGNPVLSLARTMHHDAKSADYGALIKRMKDTRALIPKGLQVNVFTYGLGETHRALYELSKPKKENGTVMTYEEFVEELKEKEEAEQRRKEEAARAAAKANASENENETEYVYSENEGNVGNNAGNNDQEDPFAS